MANKSKRDDQKETRLRLAERLRRILLELPEVCYDFILSIEPNTTVLTRINYAGDLRNFLQYLSHELQLFDKPPSELDVADLAAIRPRHIEQYLEYLSIYRHDGRVLENKNLGKKRKLSAIRTFFKYLLRHGYISDLPTTIIDTPKVLEKPIIHLDGGEVTTLLNTVESGGQLTKRQAEFQKKTRLRDVAIVTLMVGTGIRISECVGINLDDVDLEHNSFRITRKGGKIAVLYFSGEVKEALLPYLDQRRMILPVAGHQNALFLSLQKRRITARAVENLVEKYAVAAVPLKKITPHKLRSTFGTALYRATGDIYLVADVLGHKDVNTTRKHYADMSEENRKKAAEAVVYHKEQQ